MKSFMFLLIFLLLNTPVSFTQTAQVDSNYFNLKNHIVFLKETRCEIDSLLHFAKQTTKFNNQILTNTNTYVEKLSLLLSLGLGIISILAVGGGILLAIMSRRNEKYYFEQVLKRIDSDIDARMDFVIKLLGHKEIKNYILSIIENTTKEYSKDIKEIKESLNE